MGRGGLYFRATLPSSSSSRRLPATFTPSPADALLEDARLESLESGLPSEMCDSTSAELLHEINSKANRLALWPIALLLALLGHIVFVPGKTPLWLLWLTIPLSAVAVAAAAYWDNLRKTVVLFYSMEAQLEAAYQALHSAFDLARSCRASWHIPSGRHTAGLYDWKTHSGADSLVTRRRAQFSRGLPSYFKTNVLVPFIPAQRLRLYFFPDRILVYEGSKVGAINYPDLAVDTRDIQFLEEDGIPSDTKVVGRTWRYVNKSGGPDRRYSDNREIPIVLYGQVKLTSPSGLSEVFQFSRQGLGAYLNNAVTGMARAISEASEKAEVRYVVCACSSCNGHIEFPESGAGQTITCPFCKKETVLFIPT